MNSVLKAYNAPHMILGFVFIWFLLSNRMWCLGKNLNTGALNTAIKSLFKYPGRGRGGGDWVRGQAAGGKRQCGAGGGGGRCGARAVVLTGARGEAGGEEARTHKARSPEWSTSPCWRGCESLAALQAVTLALGMWKTTGLTFVSGGTTIKGGRVTWLRDTPSSKSS